MTNTIEVVGTVISTKGKYFTFSSKRKNGVADLMLVLSDTLPTENEHLCIKGKLKTKIVNKHKEVYIQADEITETSLADFCIVNLQGKVSSKTKIRQTPLGKRIFDFTLVNGSDFIPCIAWNEQASTLESLTRQEINMKGRLQSRDYLKDNKLHTVYEVSLQTLL